VKISVIIPVKNEALTIGACLERVFDQRNGSELEVVVIDSGSTDGTLEILKKFDIKLTQIPPHEFHHGRTRNLGASLASGHILVLLTADAVPSSSDWLSNLTAPLLTNTGIAASYGRQIPKDDASYTIKASLATIYPDEPMVKRLSDLPTTGLRTYHFSNVCSAFLKEVWQEVRFPEDLGICEDVGIAKRILEKGYLIAYVPTAVVRHSHNYGVQETLRRYFDIGVAFRRMGIIGNGSKGVGLVTGGMKHVVSVAKSAMREGGIGTCATTIAMNAAKSVGLALGRIEPVIPMPIKKRISLYSVF